MDLTFLPALYGAIKHKEQLEPIIHNFLHKRYITQQNKVLNFDAFIHYDDKMHHLIGFLFTFQGK